MAVGFNPFDKGSPTSVDRVDLGKTQTAQTTTPSPVQKTTTGEVNGQLVLAQGGNKTSARLRSMLAQKAPAGIDRALVQAAIINLSNSQPQSTLKDAVTTALLFGGRLSKDAQVIKDSNYPGIDPQQVMEDVHNFGGFIRPGFSEANSESTSATAAAVNADAVQKAKNKLSKERPASSLIDAVITTMLFGKGALEEAAKTLISSGTFGKDTTTLLKDNHLFAGLGFIRPGM